MLGLAGGIISGIASIGKIFAGIKQNKEANAINPVYKPYEVSPYAKKQLGLANQFLNGRMAGASGAEQNIAGAQANYGASVQRNATDSGQALSAGLLSQGQTDAAYNQLGINEAQNKQQMLGNVNNALQGMTAEGDKMYQDMLQKYQIDTQQKAALRSSAWQNIFGGVNDMASTAIQGDQLGWFGNKKATANVGYGGE